MVTDNGASETTGLIRPININEEMRGSYLDYAMSVIVSRALPDARDGLKPVHRRILFAMYDMGLRANTPHRKSARIVGEVLGKYHPHGDSAVYDAMVRMAQDFSLRYPLVDGQGNFGSMDGDSAAAMRYTEARMANIAMEMLADINMNTVDFTENYDGSQMEPVVMPSRLPNMLLNGASGIAVGMATNIPPHNLRELAAAITHIIDNQERLDEIDVDELMQFVKGPDFPTGATIIVSDELREAYGTGKGRVAIRATYEIEQGKHGPRIVITSIPYQVSKSAIIERIVSLVRDGRIDTIRDLRDESDRDGLRMVVDLKPHAKPQTVVNQLFRYTQLQTFYSIQVLALVNKEPRNLPLKRCLTIYIDHRYDVIVRRSEFELEKLRARAHILQGLLKAVSAIDEIIALIRSSDDVDDARRKLIARFEFSDAQANAILEMQLRRLAALERQKLQDEYDEVMARINYLEDLLAHPAKILALIRADMQQLAADYGDERRTRVEEGNAYLDDDSTIPPEDVIISLTMRGYVKRVPTRHYRAQRRGGKGVRGLSPKEEDVILHLFGAENHDKVLFFSNRGKVYSQTAYRIPEFGRADRGQLISNVLNMAGDESITAVVPVPADDLNVEQDAFFVMVTRNGIIKRVHLDEFKDVRPSGIIAMTLLEDDTLGWVKYTRGDQDILLATEMGQSIRFSEDEVRVMGRQAQGVYAMKLAEGDRIAGMDVIDPVRHTHVMVVTQNGFGKRTPIEEYTQQGRYGLGIRTLQRTERTGNLVAMRCVSDEDEVVLITRNGTVLRTGLDLVRETGRSTQGVTLMDVGNDDAVLTMAVIKPEADDGENGEMGLEMPAAADTPDVETSTPSD